MGTNYYLYTKAPCTHCNRPYKPLHIGKSSGGWCFALHVIPEMGINDLDDWYELWLLPEAYIEDENGDKIPSYTMKAKITNRSWSKRTFDDEGAWSIREGYATEEMFHKYNHSQRGPNGLLRQALGTNCLKHGEGTWDCIEGDFS